MKILKVSIIIVIFLVGAASLILYGFYRYNNKETKTLTDTSRKNVPGNFIKLSQGVTHYQLEGPDSAQVVILVHGFSVPYYIWDPTYDFLIKKDTGYYAMICMAVVIQTGPMFLTLRNSTTRKSLTSSISLN
ncbi:hypothetical protein ACQ86K_09235 [Mucilaginibacter sp. P19]|uniref:hypothetical protein n=1 Tax=Mucilaginibacter sp. P19 TaxID=3423947 RepID=UPI003D665207